jgi:hypothetical protein
MLDSNPLGVLQYFLPKNQIAVLVTAGNQISSLVSLFLFALIFEARRNSSIEPRHANRWEGIHQVEYGRVLEGVRVDERHHLSGSAFVLAVPAFAIGC